MKTRWHIRPYGKGDEARILQLRRAVFGDLDPVRLKEAVWKWQFEENPAGEAFCRLAEADGRVVGQYAAIPTRLSSFGSEIIAAFSCDTMIHPDFRRQGMFSALAQALYDFLEAKEGIDLVWGFPNSQSLPGFTRKLGWTVFPPIPLMVLPIRPLAVVLKLFPPMKRRPMSRVTPSEKDIGRRLSTKNQGLTIKPIRYFGEAFDDLWMAHGSLSAIMQIRDSRYLQWRYLSVPDFGYRPFAVFSHKELMGYIVLRMMALKGQRFGVLVDMFPLPLGSGAITVQTLAFAKQYVKSQGGDFLTSLPLQGHSKILKEAGFIKVPEIVNPKTWWLGIRNAKKVRVMKFADWHITYGDTDVV